MHIKTDDGTKNVASQAVGGTALGLAIPGTLAFLGQLSNGMLGGRTVAQGSECHDTRAIGTLQAELAKEKAERYADNVGIEVYKAGVERAKDLTSEANENYKVLSAQISDLDKKVAVGEQRTTDNFAFMNYKVDNVKRELEQDINCKTNALRCYVDGTFVPGKLVMPLDSICPEAMQRYNSWTAPTTTTPAT